MENIKDMGDALQRIVDAYNRGEGGSYMGYAMTYVNHLQIALDEHGTDGVRVQILYILGNLTGWRGPEARGVKAYLKAWRP